MRRMPAGTEINNQVSGATYRILEFLGEGGFGAAYAAFHIDEDGDQDGDLVCLKFTNDADVWHGEAFSRRHPAGDEQRGDAKGCVPNDDR
jgi:hypothetical protein